jgi:hypothetical protein
MTPPANQEEFEWHSHPAGSLRHLEQHLEVGDDDARLVDVEATFAAWRNRTLIEIEAPPPERTLVRTGLVLLQLVSRKGGLEYELLSFANSTSSFGNNISSFARLASLTAAASPPSADAGGCSTTGIAGAWLPLLILAMLRRRRGIRPKDG